MKISIIYASKTGHSRKIAKAIAEELNISANDFKEKPELTNVDLLFIVGGIYGGKSMPEFIDFVNSIDNSVKKVALITSSMAKKTKQDSIREILIKNNVEVEENEFMCQGSFLFFGMGHPNKKDITNAVYFARALVGRE